jgi:abortive infection bacteriophage resistance protein
MITYNKIPLTYIEQLNLLKSRGLIINNESKAESYLSQISYYRLSAYYLPFQLVKDTFNKGVTFDNIIHIYSFDRELRLLVFDAIERIEVAIRDQMIYQLAHKYGAHWQDDSTIFKPPYINPYTRKETCIYSDTQNIISNHRNAKNPEVFIKHYTDNYKSPLNPPSWMSIELLTIGELSRLYTALKKNIDKNEIASFFNLHHTVFTSWLHSMVYVRNICAHHSRLWNREFAIKPDVLLKPNKAWLQPAFNSNNHRTFYFLCVLKYFLFAANPSHHFKNKLSELIKKFPDVPIQFLGIPSDAKKNIIDWENEDIWKA